jgi:hypothetical protein
VNPSGAQRDALITEEQRAQNDTGDGDPGWDGVWTSEARRTNRGWTATIAVPFSTLNFMQSRDVIWGINFKRFIRRKNEEDLWSGWRRRVIVLPLLGLSRNLLIVRLSFSVEEKYLLEQPTAT